MSIDFTPITRLSLQSAFKGESHFDAVKKEEDFLLELFEYSDKGTLFVHDDESIGYSVYVIDTKIIGRDKLFVLHNKNHKGNCI